MTDAIHPVSAPALADALERLAQLIDDQGRLAIVHHCEGDTVVPRVERNRGDAKNSAALRRRAAKLRTEGMAAWTYQQRRWAANEGASLYRPDAAPSPIRVAWTWLSNAWAHEGEIYEVTEPMRYRIEHSYAGQDTTGRVRPGRYFVVKSGEGYHERRCIVGTWDATDSFVNRGFGHSSVRNTEIEGARVIARIDMLEWYQTEDRRWAGRDRKVAA